MVANQIIKVPERIVSVFEDSQAVKEFESILHAGANSFIKSAMIVIADSNDLQNCTPQSLVIGALRSAALGLSLDPAMRQAYLVPRPLKGIWTACFQPHYHGLYDLAVRTNKYRYISVMPIHQGERVYENPQTGIHYWAYEGTQTLFAPVQGEGGLKVESMRDVTNGKNTAPVIGYLGYFKTLKGFEKSVFMTIPEIHAHAKLWAPSSYTSPKGGWQDKKKLPIMEMKTVFIALSKFMDLTGSESVKLKEAIENDFLSEPDSEMIESTLEPVYEDIPQEQPESTEGIVSEVVIESTSPAPKRKVNEIVDDATWNNFARLVQTAANAGVTVLNYNRSKMTASEVYGASMYLQDKIKKQPKRNANDIIGELTNP